MKAFEQSFGSDDGNFRIQLIPQERNPYKDRVTIKLIDD